MQALVCETFIQGFLFFCDGMWQVLMQKFWSVIEFGAF